MRYDTQTRPSSRRRFLAAAGAATVTGLAGCASDGGSGEENGNGNQETDGGGQETGTTTGGSTPFSAEVTVTHWPLLMYAPPYQMALENGYFEEEGLDITRIVGSSGGGTTVRNVVTGGLPFGEVATPAAVNAYYAGAPLSIIAGSTNTPGTINWVSPVGSDVTSLMDLKGRTVGYTSAGSVTQNTSALAVKRAEGISADEVEYQAMGGLSEGLTAVQEGSIAAAANLEPVFSSQQQGEKQWQEVFAARDYIGEFQQTCVIAGPQVLEENPDAARGFLRARSRGVRFLRENRDEAAEIFASYNDGYDTETMRTAIENVQPENYYVRNQFSVAGLKTIEEGMRNIDLIDREVGWSEIIDQSYLPEDSRIDVSQAE